MNFPKDLKDLEKQMEDLQDVHNVQGVHQIDSRHPVWQIDKNISIYLSRSFRNRLKDPKFQRELQKDPQQLYKALRNVQYGFDRFSAMSGSGKDGVFMISLNKGYINNMVKLLTNYQIDKQEYPFLNDKIPIRVVAHPNGIRIRPVGYIVEIDNHQHIVLVEIAVDKI